MIKLPILLNGNHNQIVGTVILETPLEEIYNRANHLVLNPIIRRQADGDQEVIYFGIYPAPFEPETKRKKRGRPKKKEQTDG